MKKALGFLPALLIAAMPLLGANAATLTGSVGSDAAAAVNAASDVGASVSGSSNSGSVNAGVNTGVSADGSSNSGSDTSGSADTGVNVGVTGSSNTDVSGSNANSNGSASVNADLGANAVVMTRSDLAGDDSANGASSATLASASGVATSDDLRAFARGSMQNDPNLESEAFSDTKVEVSHDVRGRFIGLFPVTVAAKADVDAAGNVSVSYPWYAFLVSNDKANLESSIKANLAADGFSNDSSRTALSASEQARVAEDVRTAMRDSLNGSAGANGSASSTSGY